MNSDKNENSTWNIDWDKVWYDVERDECALPWLSSWHKDVIEKLVNKQVTKREQSR